jgi:hypothetical protein
MTEISTHPVSPEELMAHLDGEIPADHAQFIATHVTDCRECSELATRLQESSRPLDEWKIGDPSASLDDRVLKAAARQTPVAASANWIHRFQIFFSRPLPWAAACLTVVGLIFLQLLGRPLATFQGKKSSSAVYTTPVMNPPTDSIRRQTEPAGGGGGSSADATSDYSWATQSDATLGKLSSAGPNATLPPPPPPPHSGTAREPVEELAPMIARTANLRVVVPRFADARAKLDGALVRYHAYAATLQISTAEGAPRELIASLRIPAAQLNTAMTELKALGRVEAESQSGEEVTEQHADLVARLKNSRETELRLQDILRTRTGKVKDVLEVEEEISRVRGEIEQMEAERKTLEHRVDFAALNLTLAEEFKAQLSSPAPSLGTQWRNSIVTGSRNAFDSLFALILFLSEVAPVLLLWLAILFPLAWLMWRRFRAMRAALS